MQLRLAWADESAFPVIQVFGVQLSSSLCEHMRLIIEAQCILVKAVSLLVGLQVPLRSPHARQCSQQQHPGSPHLAQGQKHALDLTSPC